ncbi:hypothetical protein C8Q78DRAFT_1083608 [Trametes maxima]|nr:hypothetical protein C8Q78DRAFT_1083608 [Trametes maxima]
MAVVQGAPSLDHSFGAILIGTFVGLVLYGLTLHQTYRYTRICYAADRSWLKALVIAIVCLESLHIVVTVVTSLVKCYIKDNRYYHLVSGYSNPGSLGVVHWSTKALAPISGVTILLCQAFYAYRVYILGSLRIYRTLVVSATILMTVILGFTIAAFVMRWEQCRVRPLVNSSNPNSTVFELALPPSWLTSGIFGTAFLVDVLLTGTLVTVLLRSRTGFSGTDALIDTLIIYSMNTGLLTSILSLISFILVSTHDPV